MARNRDLAGVDKDLDIAEQDIKDLKNELGKVPSGNKSKVFARLDALETAAGSISALQTQQIQLGKDAAATAADITALKDKIKWTRWMILGAVASAQLVKLDLQLLKIDVTLWKKLERDNFVNWAKRFGGFVRDLSNKEAARIRKQNEQTEKDLKDKAEEAEKKLQEKIRALPETVEDMKKKIGGFEQRMDGVEKAVKLSTLRSHFDTVYLQKSKEPSIHQGIRAARTEADKANRDIESLRTRLRAAGSAGTPNANPPKGAKKDVTDLRVSVKDLSEALAGI
ncbi:hypothetical protein ACWD3Z_28675 [Streptomyces sp. NPDC002740]